MKFKIQKLYQTALSVLLITVLLFSVTIPSFASAVEEDTLVQCDSSGTVTDHTAITGVTLPVTFTGSEDYYCTVDAAVSSGGSPLKTVTGLVPDEDGKVSVSLGAVTGYSYDTVYEIQYRGHYFVSGEDTELIGTWLSSGLYFKVELAAVTGALLNPNSEVFDLYAPDDVETTITWNDADNVTDITVDGESIGSDSYSVTAIDSDTATLTINQEFLETKAAGDLALTVSFNKGGTERLDIEITDSTPPTISPAAGSFDLSDPADVSTNITWNSADDVEDVTCDGDSLSSSDDYTVSGSRLLISSDYLENLNLSDGDTADFEITFDTGDTVTFTVDAEDGYTLGDDASLNSLKVGGVSVSGFDPDIVEYDAELPYGTQAGSAAAAVSASANDSKASVIITQAAILPGSASIYVVAEDTISSITYIVNLTLGDAPDVSVTNLTVAGTSGADSVKSGQTLQMIATITPGSATDQTVTWSVANVTGSAIIDANGLLTGVTEGAVTVRATANDGSDVYGEAEITVTKSSSGGSSSGGDSNHNGSSGSSQSDTDTTMMTEEGRTTGSTEVTGTTGSDGTAKAAVIEKIINDVIAAVTEEAAKKGTDSVVEIYVDADDDATGISLTFPQGAITALKKQGFALTISSPFVTITFDERAIKEISSQTGGDITITAVGSGTFDLSGGGKSAVRLNPVFELSVTTGSTSISDFGGGKARVTIPFTPASGKNSNEIVVYSINASGKAVIVPNCFYNVKSKTVVFTTTHFSTYGVGYNEVNFSDVSDTAWYADYVSYLASRDIIGGSGSGQYSPEAKITRAQFVTILSRMSGNDLSGYTSSSFSDVTSSDWYSAAAEWANANGIATGSNEKFDPNAGITREQMAAMLYRYAEYTGTINNAEGMSAREFSDYGGIASWAQSAVQWAVNNEIVSGNPDGSFAPASGATRAQATKMISVMLQGMI